MSLQDLLREGHLRPQETNVQEVTDLLEVADRALHDAGIPQLSPDGKYITTYNAALALATMVVRASGYRVSGSAHHWAAFAALPELLGATAQGRADQFDKSRRKRNRAIYSRAGQISEEEAARTLAAVRAFRSEVLDWLHANHRELLPEK